jgi:hypothetical protein
MLLLIQKCEPSQSPSQSKMQEKTKYEGGSNSIRYPKKVINLFVVVLIPSPRIHTRTFHPQVFIAVPFPLYNSSSYSPLGQTDNKIISRFTQSTPQTDTQTNPSSKRRPRVLRYRIERYRAREIDPKPANLQKKKKKRAERNISRVWVIASGSLENMSPASQDRWKKCKIFGPKLLFLFHPIQICCSMLRTKERERERERETGLSLHPRVEAEIEAGAALVVLGSEARRVERRGVRARDGYVAVGPLARCGRHVVLSDLWNGRWWHWWGGQGRGGWCEAELGKLGCWLLGPCGSGSGPESEGFGLCEGLGLHDCVLDTFCLAVFGG